MATFDPVQKAFGGQIDDAEAVFRMMQSVTPKTDKAATLRAQFLTWYKQSSWYDKNFSQSWYDEMRSRKNAFNIANAVTEADKALVTRVLTTGMTAEEMQGKPRPAIDVKTGLVGTALKKPPAVPVVGGNPSFTRNLKKGLQGEDVKKWQTFLGLTPPTGYFDALTDTRTREYQKKNGLTVDGIVGPKTLKQAFPVAKAPFAEPGVTQQQVVSSIKIPTSGGSSQKPSATPASPSVSTKPASSPQAKTPASDSLPATSTPAVLKAGMLGGITKLPLWAKLTGVGLALGATGAAILGAKEAAKRS